MKLTLSDLVGNISGIAAFAIIVAGVGGFFVALLASVIGRPLDTDTAALVNTFIQILIGLAVGAGAGSGALAMRMTRAMEMDAQARASEKFSEK